MLPLSDVARHFGIDWKTVKDIDKHFLEQDFGKTDYEGLRVLAVDEIAISKGHQYLTVVLDYLSGRVVWTGKDRTKETLADFFAGMTTEQRQKLDSTHNLSVFTENVSFNSPSLASCVISGASTNGWLCFNIPKN